MKNIFIIGSKGYHKSYGGWETFVSNLVEHYDDPKTTFYVSEICETKMTRIKNSKINNHLYVTPIYVPHMGGATMMFYTMKAFRYYLNYIKHHNIKKAYIYVLGLKLGPMLLFGKKKREQLGVQVIVNPDGLEWKRSKWNKLTRKFFVLSEHMMLHQCDKIICDSKGIKEYLDITYPKIECEKEFIAYGIDPFNLSNTNQEEILKKYQLMSNQYFLMVGRFVPENNYELIIKEFMKTKTTKELIIISNLEQNKFYRELLKNTNFDKDKRIRFLGSIYNPSELASIRKNAFAYIHGHSVGGTNPSLLEAMSLTTLNLLYDVNFNREVGMDTCLYFSHEEDNLASLIDSNLDADKNRLEGKALTRMKKDYSWKKITNDYKKIFK